MGKFLYVNSHKQKKYLIILLVFNFVVIRDFANLHQIFCYQLAWFRKNYFVQKWTIDRISNFELTQIICNPANCVTFIVVIIYLSSNISSYSYLSIKQDFLNYFELFFQISYTFWNFFHFPNFSLNYLIFFI